MEEVMTTLVNVYGRIQVYQEQQSLANYIADISSTAANDINISKPELVSALNELEIHIRSNLVLKQYKTAVDAFKQWIFPFAHTFLETSMLPSHLELEENIENLAQNAFAQIEKMKLKLDLYKTSVKSSDKYLNIAEFNSRYVSTEPFFVWKNEEYVNETKQSRINEVLKGFDIIANHLGNSYYRYDNKIYLITSDSQSIFYSIEKNTAGEPVRKNWVYQKLKNGDLMLSPYTLWEIKMINSTSKISFRDLEVYKNEFDLELSGFGSYVAKQTSVFKSIDYDYRMFDEIDSSCN
ncbi:uncharacterized protein CEXT_753831 [Caerostris extrusa]|uniref:Uncharacterized protein n=1 Tax=Caerostris extrusa TaxID=172846 RepID=A0AAV4VJ40_CAEEX|nr:uncharacterized protein CEXT_753831 [Caerostris extrusa]